MIPKEGAGTKRCPGHEPFSWSNWETIVETNQPIYHQSLQKWDLKLIPKALEPGPKLQANLNQPQLMECLQAGTLSTCVCTRLPQIVHMLLPLLNIKGAGFY